jgi:hypothetical protein
MLPSDAADAVHTAYGGIQAVNYELASLMHLRITQADYDRKAQRIWQIGQKLSQVAIPYAIRELMSALGKPQGGS